MAPGVGGNGNGGRQTGTVPKTKSHNESSREYNGASRRDYQNFINHMPNNLSSLDWQPVNESHPPPRTRKESNTSASRFSEPFDTGEENGAPDNLWFNCQRGNGPQYHSDDDEVSQASWAENGYKSNNLGAGLADKAQVASRLHQIRDYVSQTVNMMDSLRATGGQRNMVQHEKLAAMLEGLRDSELKLQTLYERIERMPQPRPEVEGESYSNHQMMESPRERSVKPVVPLSKSSESARKNELKKQVQLSQIKLQELQEQQSALKALKLRAQDELNEARAAQGALMSAHGHNQQSSNVDMLQDRLLNLQRFFDTRHQVAQLVGLDDRDVDTADMQNKLDELQAKKQHMDQLLAQFSNNTDELTPEECERDVESKIAELNAMRETLAVLQNNISAHLQPPPPPHSHPHPHTHPQQDRPVRKESRTSVEKSNTSTSHALQAKTQQLQEARSKLQQLQTLLQTVEELREAGQPIPESVLQLLTNSDFESSPTHTHPDRSEMSSQDLNLSQPISERLVNSCDRADLYNDRSCRSLNSCERERVNQQPPANSSKSNNQEGKLGAKMQLEELMRNQELNPQPLHSSSFQENSTTTGTWGGSTQDPLDDGHPEFTGDMNESGSVKNATSMQTNNIWRIPSSGSWAAHSPYVPQEVRRSQPTLEDTLRPVNMPQQPDNHCIVHQISQLQSQLQQMTGLYKNFVEKQHNCGPPAPWLPPAGLTAPPIGPYCQYIASASQWQQQQLLVHSLNQCCQLIWHQQRELVALKEALALLQQPPDGAGAHYTSPPPSNLGRPHGPLKPSLSVSAGPAMVPPAVVSSAHSLPNLTSPQTTPASPTPAQNRNLLSSPHSLPPQHSNLFPDPHFVNLYPPYGNNLNFEFPSPVNFFPNPPEPFLAWAAPSQTQPAATLNNQVPPGNRANNYWDNFRSYSRQNLLSSSGKSNDGLPLAQAQRTPMERFLNTDLPHPQLSVRKERLNTTQSEAVRGLAGEAAEGGGDMTNGPADRSQPAQCQHNSGRRQRYSPHRDVRSSRLVNDCEAPRGANKKPYSTDASPHDHRKVNKRNIMEAPGREVNLTQLNNYQPEVSGQAEGEVGARQTNRGQPRNVNSNTDCVGDGYCLMAADKSVRRKDNRGNVNSNGGGGGGEWLEECVYSEVAALISANEWRPQFLLQLFKDLRLLSSNADSSMMAATHAIHALAASSAQGGDKRLGVNEEVASGETERAGEDNSSHQPPRNWSHTSCPRQREHPPPQLPTNCAKLDWEVRSVLTELLPFIKCRAGEVCGGGLLEALRRLILRLVPAHATQDQLDAQLEDALHKFHGTRLGDVYEELLTVVADVLTSELTFLRLVNTVHHSSDQPNGENVVEEVDVDLEVEGAVGGVVVGGGDEHHPANQPRRTKSETVSEADLAEADRDQSRHTEEEEERGDTAEGIDLLDEEASGRSGGAVCGGAVSADSNAEAAGWAVEEDRELGLDQVPTRLLSPESEPQNPSGPAPDAGPI